RGLGDVYKRQIQDNPNEKIYRAQAETIRKIVKSGESCVIVGRGADYVLRNRPEVLKVYIYAPYSIRVETVMERYNFSKDEAEKVVRYMDKTRKNYYEYFTDNNWDQKEGKDMLIDNISIFSARQKTEYIEFQSFGNPTPCIFQAIVASLWKIKKSH
ncbi:MAG: cytidylate kinase-like family protein, partial [Muribaculaceae bacterium]|nr:cytidylate kinase-like family protein [Muribaculaceae bacterium]